MRSMIPGYLSEAIADVAPDTSGLRRSTSPSSQRPVVREAVNAVPAEAGMALDLTRVHSVADVARRMLLEITPRRLALDGHEVVVASLDTLARTGRR